MGCCGGVNVGYLTVVSCLNVSISSGEDLIGIAKRHGLDQHCVGGDELYLHLAPKTSQPILEQAFWPLKVPECHRSMSR